MKKKCGNSRQAWKVIANIADNDDVDDDDDEVDNDDLVFRGGKAK